MNIKIDDINTFLGGGKNAPLICLFRAVALGKVVA